MIRFNDELLKELGLEGLSSQAQATLLEQMRSNLELRVGEALTSLMSDREIDEFKIIYESGDEKAALAWLSTTCPDYADAVRAAFIDLKSEVKRLAPSILASQDETESPVA